MKTPCNMTDRMVILCMFLFVLCPVFAKDGDAGNYYTAGRDALLADNPFNAIASFRSALRLNPAYVDARLGMAEALFQLTEYDEAAKELDTARPLAGNLQKLKLLDARIKTSLGLYTQAVGIYRSILVDRPHDADANRGLGEIFAITGQYNLADEAFNRSLQYSPGDRRVLLQLILLYDKAREKDQADAVLAEALRLFPDDLTVRIQAAEHYMMYHQWAEAMKQLDRVHSMLAGTGDERYPRVVLLNAELFLRQGNPAGALEILETLPNLLTLDSLLLRARSYRHLKMEKEAQEVLGYLLRKWKDDEIARMIREEYFMRTSSGFTNERAEAAQWHLRRGRAFEDDFFYIRAYNEFRRARLLDKDNPDIWMVYTDIIRKLGFPEHYLDSLNAALKDIPVSRKEYAVLKERRDLQEHSGKIRLAGKWDIDDPWSLKASEWDIGIYVAADSSSLLRHTGAENTLALYLADLIDLLPDIRIPLDASGRNPKVGMVSGFADAFRQSRNRLDYFMLVSFAETGRAFRASAELFIAKTGEKIGRYDEMRTGQGMVTDALHGLSLSLVSAVPRLMSIVAVDGSQVLLDKGRWQGINRDDTWVVVKHGAAHPAKNDDGILYPASDYLGTVVIGETSEPLSEGMYTRFRDFDFIAPGDMLYLLPLSEILESDPDIPDPAFRIRLLAIP